MRKDVANIQCSRKTCSSHMKKGEQLKLLSRSFMKDLTVNAYDVDNIAKSFKCMDNNLTIDFTTETTDRVKVVQNKCKCCVSASCTKHSHKNECRGLHRCNRKIQQTNEQKKEVESKLFVREICCPAEVPMINDVLMPLDGVYNVKVNTTTKNVYVKHDPDIIDATKIVAALNIQKFGAQLRLDGGQTISAIIAPDSVESKFHAKAICCASEIPMITNVLKPMKGVFDVKVNTTTKMVYVNHNPKEVSADDILCSLNKEKFGARLEVDGASLILNQARTNKEKTANFVESTFLVSSLFDESVVINVKKALRKHFTKDQVSHFEAHVLSRTIKVDHNPYLVKTDGIVSCLSQAGVEISVYSDGLQEGLWTLQVDDEEDIEESKPRLHWQIALSGVLWAVSLLYMIGGKWECLEYVALVSIAFGIPKIASKAFATLQRLQFDTNCMMLFATVGAVALQDYTEAAAVAFLFSLSEWLEDMSTSRARDALSSIAKLRPERARVRDDETKKYHIVPATSVPVGSIVVVPTGDKIPCDGVIVEGTSTLDESSLTGESRPIRKSIGDTVCGGTINSGRTQLVVKTTSLADDSAVARLIRLVEDAQTNRSPTELFIDEFAKLYTPAVVMTAISMCTFPWMISPSVGREWTRMGLVTIVIACPCALIISTPVTYVAGIAAAAQKGIVVKGGVHLEVCMLYRCLNVCRNTIVIIAEFDILRLFLHYLFPRLCLE